MRYLWVLAWLLGGCGVAMAADAVPAASYFPVLPFDAPADAVPQWVPLAANHALDGVHDGLTRAILVVPDENRDANGAMAVVQALAGASNQSIMILSPQFLLTSDLVRFANYLPEKGRAFATWSLSGWVYGDDSMVVAGRKSVSSFTVVDLLLMYLADRKAFPDLREVVIVGSGLGANFVQRYAAVNAAADVLGQQNIDLRYLVAGASSYLYMTATRPFGGRKGFGRPDSVACPAGNDYPYGLDKLNPYARHVGANSAKTDYALRFITYINAPAGDVVPDSSCAAMQQGKDGGERANWFRLYLTMLYGDVAERTQVFSAPQNVKNDAVGLLGSACGMAVLFGDGLCSRAVGENP